MDFNQQIERNSFKRLVKTIARFGLVLLLISLNSLALADVLIGDVVSVSDGDTITLLDANKSQHKIRLAGIDAPEKTQAFGQPSKKSLSDLIFHKQVTVYWEKTDRHQRILCKVTLDAQDVCLEQVKLGMAWHYKQYQRDQSQEDRIKYSRAEEEARKRRIGLWSDKSPVEPSKFRHTK